MQGDFTRNSDDPAADYSGVLMQQGRVQLDADWNEQRAIQTRALRSALWDLIGDHGGPRARLGFAITIDENKQVAVGEGVYYVDGIRCVARGKTAIAMPRPDTYLAFLDVWERHVNAIEDPRTREVALLGPDTASRAEVVARVRLLRCTKPVPTDNRAAAADALIATLRQRPRRTLKARANTVNTSDDPCKLSPLAQFRGRENQLYRVEIHDATSVASPAGASKDAASDAVFTFKWSRDNGSVVFPIVRVAAPDETATATALAGDGEIAVTVTLGHLGREERFGLAAGDIVEFVHDGLTRGMLDPPGLPPIDEGGRDPGRPGLLGRVMAPIDRDAQTVRVAVFSNDITESAEGTLHPYLRRWDQRGTARHKLWRGAVPVRTSELGTWLALEDGIEVKFDAATTSEQRSGDYWQIPARTATGDVLWPQEPQAQPGNTVEDVPAFVRPHGPQHHYAPLAYVFVAANSSVFGVRRQFAPVAIPEDPEAPTPAEAKANEAKPSGRAGTADRPVTPRR
jgi:hypothetical protein